MLGLPGLQFFPVGTGNVGGCSSSSQFEDAVVGTWLGVSDPRGPHIQRIIPCSPPFLTWEKGVASSSCGSGSE